MPAAKITLQRRGVREDQRPEEAHQRSPLEDQAQHQGRKIGLPGAACAHSAQSKLLPIKFFYNKGVDSDSVTALHGDVNVSLSERAQQLTADSWQQLHQGG